MDKRLIAQEKQIICRNSEGRFRYFGWPSITRLPDGALAMVASGLRLRHVCPFGKGVICYSRDEGETWTLPAVALDTPLDDRDCGIVCFDQGRVMLTSFNNSLAFQRRCNQGGRGSTDPVKRAEAALIDTYLDDAEHSPHAEKLLGSTYRISDDGGYRFGPVILAPVSAPHGPCALPDGGLLYVGRRFSADDSFDDGRVPYIQCWRWTGQDQFAFLSEIDNCADAAGPLLSCEPHALALPNGKIIVHIRAQREKSPRAFTVFQSESIDGGRHFSMPRQLLTALGGAPAHLMRHSSGILISAYGYRESPYGIRVMFSRDEGEHWETDYILDDTGKNGDLGYPATVELHDGSLLTVFYENIGTETVIMQKRWQLPER